jgi:hypothetical protein
MSRLIPEGFLTIRQAAEELAVAIYSGEPERAEVKRLRETEGDVADGVAIAAAISQLWSAADRGKIQAFVVGPTGGVPLKLTTAMSKGIPHLRSPRGGTLHLLRPSNPYHKQFAEWFGPDLSTVSVVFRGPEVTKLARTLLRARRRRAASAAAKSVGRPSRKLEVKTLIPKLVDQGRWSPTQSIKALTKEVNRAGKWSKNVSDDTVGRALDQLHAETADRRFERVHRKTAAPT